MKAAIHNIKCPYCKQTMVEFNLRANKVNIEPAYVDKSLYAVIACPNTHCHNYDIAYHQPMIELKPFIDE